MRRNTFQNISRAGHVCAVFVVLGILLALNAFSASPDPLPRFSIGFSIKSFPDVDAKDANAAIKLWVTEIAAQAKMRPESAVYGDMKIMLADFNKERIDFISIPTVDFFRNEALLLGSHGYIGVRKGKKTERYVILSAADNKLGNLLLLKKRKLAVVLQDDIGVLFLNTLLLRQHQPEMDQFFSAIDSKPKHSQAIYAVFFGSADACVVPERLFNTMAEMNPQVGKKLKVLAASADLVTAVSIYRKEYPQTLRGKMDLIALNFKNYPRGKQILTLFQVEDLAVMNDKDLAEMRNLFREYKRLKGKLL